MIQQLRTHARVVVAAVGTFVGALVLMLAPSAHAQWTEASSTALLNTTVGQLSSALYNVLVIIIPVAVAVGVFFFAYAWIRGVFSNRR